MMLINRKLISLIFLCGMSDLAFAEGNCPTGYYPVGDNSAPGCAPIPGGAEDPNSYHNQVPSPPPQPAGRWLETWGAISFGETSVAGVATGMVSQYEAEAAALSDCKAKGGSDCKVSLAYQNQCGVIAWGVSGATTARAGSIEQASSMAMRSCAETSADCQIYYSNCSKPEFIRY